MKYKKFWVKTGTKELTDAVCKHGEYLGYKEVYKNPKRDGNVFFFSDGDYHKYNCQHTEEELSIQEFFTLTKEDVIMSKPEVKTDQELLYRLDNFFTKLLGGRIEINDTYSGLCNLLDDNGFASRDVFSKVIDVTKWDKYSGRVTYPVPLYDVDSEIAFATHENKWDKKHPYGRNRWEFVEWCREQVKAQIEQEDIEFPVLVQNIHNKAVILFTGKNSGVFCDDNNMTRWVGDYSANLRDIDSSIFKILKTAKELGLQVRGEK